ncbi:NAD(P)-dependent alcohol dehydrogenase [Synechococcus sp. CS-602]|nr:alcohol dehydrogenase [Synechococcus sp. SynAce01]MCT0203086.1 NAD(P)-dependent alcohol dehydrogenase [Synechococcus sp. CS-603]MCT0204722.1 NAD(P)-dependent alcohol dehydrogenase [Synechococcus sp. CS-602]MCT0246144.1 NAD(P)-dependent alcohol dehydrogenase [Synechococcus sp. CS-601]
MRAITQDVYGSADVLSLQTVEKPAIGDKDLLIRVRATSVHAGDWHLMRGKPFLVIRLFFGGLRRPKFRTLGCDVAGTVEAIGKGVGRFQVGDAVFGDLSVCGFGTFAEYARATEDALTLKPATISFEAAGTVACSGLAALQGLRDQGQLQAGQHVLILGAAGGVGSFAVQIAKAFGAEVTGACSAHKMAMVRSIGADHVIDLAGADFSAGNHRYDLILDTAAYGPLAQVLPALTPDGTYVLVGGSTARFFQVMLWQGPWISRTSRRRVGVLASNPNPADLQTLADLLESGKIVPFIDRRCGLTEVPEAITALEQRQVQGKIAIAVAPKSSGKESSDRTERAA